MFKPKVSTRGFKLRDLKMSSSIEVQQRSWSNMVLNFDQKGWLAITSLLKLAIDYRSIWFHHTSRSHRKQNLTNPKWFWYLMHARTLKFYLEFSIYLYFFFCWIIFKSFRNISWVLGQQLPCFIPTQTGELSLQTAKLYTTHLEVR